MTIHEKIEEAAESLHYKSLFESNTDAVAALDTQGRFTSVNKAFLQLSKYTQEEALSMTFEPLLLEDSRELAYYHFGEALLGKTQEYEISLKTKDGDVLDFFMKHIPISVDSQVIGVYAIAKDITRYKQLFLQLQQSNDNYKLIEENSFDVISKQTKEGVITYVSPSSKALLGYDPDKLLGQYYHSLIHPEDLLQIRNIYHKQAELGFHPLVNTLTYRMKKKNGEYIWCESTVKDIVCPKEEKVQEQLCITRDISARKQAEELLLQSEKLNVAGQLAAGIAHEIRNPLTSLKGFVQLIQSSKENKASYYKIMNDEFDRIEAILSELLLLAKPQKVEHTSCDVDYIITQVISLLNAQAIMKSIQIIYKPFKEKLYILCDQNQMKQAFINFIKNAMESMPHGGYVHIDIKRIENKIIIKIQDQGIGIEKEMLLKLGEPFYTTKEKGTGLGLMVTYSIIKNHHGEVRVKSKLRKGTTFTIILPVHKMH